MFKSSVFSLNFYLLNPLVTTDVLVSQCDRISVVFHLILSICTLYSLRLKYIVKYINLQFIQYEAHELRIIIFWQIETFDQYVGLSLSSIMHWS